MLTDYKSLSQRDPLSRMSQLLLAGSQHDFPVIDNDRVVGVVTRDDFLDALTQHGESIAISAVMTGGAGAMRSLDGNACP